MTVDPSPLLDTIARLDETLNMAGRLRLGMGEDDEEGRWIQCSSVDVAWYQGWEARVGESLAEAHGTGDLTMAAAHALTWYAAIPGEIGGAFFRAARRVPDLAPEHLAFRISAIDPYPEHYALLSPNFWCLPGDVAADDPGARVVLDEGELAAILRQQVRAHADTFLRTFQPGSRLPRQALLGAFVDGVDTGVWIGGSQEMWAAPSLLADSALALPGATTEFRQRSSLYVLKDSRDRDAWVMRDRIACCFRYRVGARECGTCPRMDDGQRRERMSAESPATF